MYTLSKAITDGFLRRGIIAQPSYDRCLYGMQLILTSALLTLIMLLAGIFSGYTVQTLVYMGVYWTIHSVAESYHCKKYYQCFILTLSLYLLMLLCCHFISAGALMLASWFIWALTGALLLTQILAKKYFKGPDKKQLAVNGAAMLIALVLLALNLQVIAFPFVYGKLVINILQSKVRFRKNESY